MKSMLKLEQLHPPHTRHFVKNLVSAVWILLIIFAIFPLALSGQSLAGELRLTVEDPSGRVMQASGKLVNVSNGKSRTFQTDAQGAYTFKNLSYGHYKLEVSWKGFSVQMSEIEVEGETPVMCTLTLSLAPVNSDITVVGSTPLGSELSRDTMAAPVQTANQTEIEHSGALALSDLLNLRLDGVHINEIQGNPFQPDVNYRGYTASPLLGTPQGLSVYMDGVRLNQPFGDVVSWDLIPRVAISEVTLMPGSNPLFGLNTMGGALSVLTKNGQSQPGIEFTLSGGSFGRVTGDVQYGGSNSKGLSWFVASTLFFENGWRDDSPSDVRQFFGKFGWRRARTTVGLTLAYANNSLIGNGLQDQRLLVANYDSIYTKPDVTSNRSPFLNFSVQHNINDKVTLSGNFYYRNIRTSTLNGDINDDSLDQSLYQPNAAERAALAEAGYTGFPTSGENASNTPFPSWRCIAQALLQEEPGEKCNGLLNRTHSEQENYGLSGQLTWLKSVAGYRNQFTAGAAYDQSDVNFVQSSQLGFLNPDRSVTGVDAFGDGVTGGNVDGEPFDTRVDLHGVPSTGSFYTTDTLSLGNAWNFTFSGRYNRTTIDNTDRVRPGGGAGSLDGYSVFDRFNPAFGITFSKWRFLNSYFGYSEGSRAPTSIELGCADPNQPCKLPNALAGDPPLNQVVTRTWEVGLRSGEGNKLHCSAGWFRADNRDDILFVTSTQTGFGYFKNFGRTRRQGFEVDVNSRISRVNFGGGYTFLDATYQSPETLDGSGNSTNDTALSGTPGTEGTIQIQPGARIPLIPQHMLKAFANIQATSKLSVDLTMVAVSSSFSRGNENNLHEPDGKYYLGSGTSPGYGVVNLGSRYQANQRLQVFAQINNLFDHHYYTAAQLGSTGLTSAGAFMARPFPAVGGEFPIQNTTFYAPGAPIGVWAGMRIKF